MSSRRAESSEQRRVGHVRDATASRGQQCRASRGMRVVMTVCGVVVAVVFATMSSSRGDNETSDPALTEEAEPITGTEVTPFKGSEQPMKDPFVPYGTGAEGPSDVWKYEDLTAAERAIADHGLNEDQTAVQDNYAAAARAMAVQANAESAAIQLGLDAPLGEIGVVP